MTFLDTRVVVRMVVTHLRNPMEGAASGTRALSTKDTSGISSACRNVAADSNQNKQVICAKSVSYFPDRITGSCGRTSAANSAMLPPLLFTDSGILKFDAMTFPELFFVSNPKSLLLLARCL
jgi:hypothetical protein